MYLWIRMSAAIAHLGGHDIHTQETKALVFLTILGGDTPDISDDTLDLLIPLIIKR